MGKSPRLLIQACNAALLLVRFLSYPPIVGYKSVEELAETAETLAGVRGGESHGVARADEATQGS